LAWGLHGSQLWIDSTQNDFEGRLPVLAKRILLSNHPEILRPMEDSLFHREGFSLLIAADGRQAFEIIEEHDPALAILDLEMMNVGGDNCCRRVKGDPILSRTPVILVARRGGEEEVLRCRQAGCNEIIFKPIDTRELLAAACRLLGLPERRSPRVTLSLPARVGRNPRHLHAGTIRDLNGGGAFIETHQLVPVNTEMIVEFLLPGVGEILRTPCRVAWVNHPEWMKEMRLPVGMGLQFVDLAETARKALREVIVGQEHNPDGGGMAAGDGA